MSGRREKVLVAMSGGVDSSVAAALLLRQGHEVVGCFMRLGSPGETFDELTPDSESCDPSKLRIGHQGCCSINDAADARLVAARLGVPFYVVNFKKDFGRIIDYFVGEYNAGRTPNPCVRCNDWLKFGRLHEYAKQIDARYVASGHYARIDRNGTSTPRDSHPWASPRLLRGVDRDKDQSYVLFGAPRERLNEMLLPIGGYRKSEIRALAREFDLPVFDKPDSQEICFVPDNDYAGLVKRRTPDAVSAGAILDPDGREIGAHAGHQHFTIGQRRGVGVALGYPIYVVDRDPQANTITVGPREMLLSDGCTARESNWLIDEPALGEWRSCLAKIRYNSEPVPARVQRTGEGVIEVRFDEPQFAVAPGQAVVCYDAAEPDVVIGGGWIDAAL
ncbi:MAG: tRNA 2-thiouridine(34) synthase MnmA [Phycisphaerales bacterium]|nr:tRNA 2-thiouridine(34) synthase MnmA [Phycisphaerales bacterium]